MPLSRRHVTLGLIVGLVLGRAAGSIAAAAPVDKRSVVVEVAPEGWRAEAVVRALTADLADDRLATRSAPDCRGPCDDGALRTAGVELVVRAVLDAAGPATLGYELRGLWPGAPAPVRGVLALRGLDRAGFAGALRDRLHRIGRTSGEDTGSDAGEASAAALPTAGEIAGALGIVLAFLATPFVGLRRRRVAERVVPEGAGRKRWARAAAVRTLVGVASVAAVALAISALGPVNERGIVLAAGGIAWGAFVAVSVPVVFPPLVGLGQVDYSDLGRLVLGWVGLAVRRAVMVALLYAPVAVAIAFAPAVAAGSGRALADDTVRLALVLPLALLVMRQWARLAIAVIAERLDDALVDPTADAAGWQEAVRGYFVGYLRRNALAIDVDLLDRVQVWPAAGDEVCVYGGGATPPRIAIPRKMLELALAPWGRPHDYAAPRVSTLHWTQWNAGLVMASEAGAPIATREQRQPRETTAEGDPSENAREHLGEPPTLAGIIEPTALDPRTRYRPHDDPAWLDWDVGEEHDGTDAGDRDFLFGALIHAVARIQRHGDRPATLALALQRRVPAGLGRIPASIARFLDGLSDAIGDDHAAIRGARHHLVQYLGWLAWQREDLLTARAYAPELEAMSRRVLAEPAPQSATPTAAHARARLDRFAGLVRGAPVGMVWRRLALAGALAAGAGALVLAVVDAVRYHASYAAHSSSEMERPHGKE